MVSENYLFTPGTTGIFCFVFLLIFFNKSACLNIYTMPFISRAKPSSAVLVNSPNGLVIMLLLSKNFRFSRLFRLIYKCNST